MSYNASSPITFRYTGLALSSAQVPADVATFKLPITGIRYICQNPILYQIAGTGDMGGLGVSFQAFTLPGGSGQRVISAISVGALLPGAATYLNSTVTGFATSPTIVLRQNLSPIGDITGLVGLSFQVYPLL